MKNKTPLKMTFEELEEMALCISECDLNHEETIEYIEANAEGLKCKKEKSPAAFCIEWQDYRLAALLLEDSDILFTDYIQCKKWFNFYYGGNFVAKVKTKKIPNFCMEMVKVFGCHATTFDLDVPF